LINHRSERHTEDNPQKHIRTGNVKLSVDTPKISCCETSVDWNIALALMLATSLALIFVCLAIIPQSAVRAREGLIVTGAWALFCLGQLILRQANSSFQPFPILLGT
jgi:hypothetical protein